MKNFKSTLKKCIYSLLTIITTEQIASPIALASVLKNDLFKSSCTKSYSNYYNCDFSNYVNKSLNNINTFSLPMDFKVEYSRGFCGSKFENGRFYDDYFNLELVTSYEAKKFLPGNFRVKLHGNSLMFVDRDPWITKNIEYFEPCRLIIYKIEVNFSDIAKAQIDSIIERNKIVSNLIEQKNNINKIITELINGVAISNNLNLSDNIGKLIKNINDIAADDTITEKEYVFLKLLEARLLVSFNGSKSKLSENYITNINNIFQNIKNKLDEKLNKIDYSIYYNNNVILERILYEIENEPNFNRSALDNFKTLIKR